MKKILLVNSLVISLVLGILFSGCTENVFTREFGGTSTINLEAGERLVNVTWKNNDIWLLTKEGNETPQSYKFKEYSNLGILEGTVIITEK